MCACLWKTPGVQYMKILSTICAYCYGSFNWAVHLRGPVSSAAVLVLDLHQQLFFNQGAATLTHDLRLCLHSFLIHCTTSNVKFQQGTIVHSGLTMTPKLVSFLLTRQSQCVNLK